LTADYDRYDGHEEGEMAVYLVVAHQTATSTELRNRLAEIIEGDRDSEFFVLVPETPARALLVWDEREAGEVARDNGRQLADAIAAAGGVVRGVQIARRGVIDAISDEVRTHPEIDTLVISTFPGGVSSWLGLDLVTQARRQTGLPVIHVVSPPRRAPRTRPGNAPGQPAATQTEPVEAAAQPLPFQEYRARVPGASESESYLRRALANNPAVLEAVERFDHSLGEGAGISPELRQLARLRVAIHTHSEYLWHDAVREARRLGMSDDRIAAVEHWYASERVRFSEVEREALRLVDSAMHRGGVSERTFASVREHLTDSAAVGLAAAVADAQVTALLAQVLDVGTEERFVGWELY